VSTAAPHTAHLEATSPYAAPARAAWSFRPDIEGLRAVAILAVVLFHTGWSGMAAGYLGVDVFFVLSGFLITGILIDEVERTGTVSLVRFWARRARRLLPASVAVVLGVLLVDRWVQSPFEQIVTAHGARAFAVYASNMLFAIRGANYFAADLTRNPLLHTWSLSVEEQFYLVFAPLLWLLARAARGDRPADFRRRLGWIVAALLVMSFAGCLIVLRRNAVLAFYSLPTRAWEFGLGALAALPTTLAARVNAHRRAASLASVAALAVLIATFAWSGATMSHPGWMTLLPTLATVTLIVGGIGAASGPVARLLSAPAMRVIGKLSYSWYLWHWPVIVWARGRVPGLSPAGAATAALASLIPAAIMYRVIESPIRFSPRLQRTPGRVVAGAVVVAGITLGAALIAERDANAVLATPAMAPIAEAARDIAPVFTNGCNLLTKEVRPRDCAFGPASNDTTVVLVGDSHAAHWFPALLAVASERGWRLIAWTKAACPAVAVTVVNREMGRPFAECDAWRDSVFRRVGAMRPTMVVAASYGDKYAVVRGDSTLDMAAPAPVYDVWTEGLATTVERLARSGARVLVLQDSPHPDFGVPDCLALNLAAPARCDFARDRAVDGRLATLEEAAVERVNGASYVRVDDLLCGANTCAAERDGIVRFQDDHHLSRRFSESLAPELSKRLTAALLRE